MQVEQFKSVSKDIYRQEMPIPKGNSCVAAGANPATVDAEARILTCSSATGETISIDGGPPITVLAGTYRDIGVNGGEALTYA